MATSTIQPSNSENRTFSAGRIVRGEDEKGRFVSYEAAMPLARLSDAEVLTKTLKFVKKKMNIKEPILSSISTRTLSALDSDSYTFEIRGYTFPNRDALSEKMDSTVNSLAKHADEYITRMHRSLRAEQKSAPAQ